MRHTKKFIFDRVLAMVLTVLMVFTMLPGATLQAFASTDDYPDHYTVTVTDGENPIVGATVTLTGKEDCLGFEMETTTDADGVAAFAATEMVSAFSATALEEYVDFLITVVKDGYETATVNYSDFPATTALTTNSDVVMSVPAPDTATVSVTVTGDATVEVNGTVQNAATVNVGTDVPVKITPAAGSYIKTLTVGGETVSVTKGEAYEGTVKAEADVAIVATVVKEFTVSAPAVEGGAITLNGGNDASLTVDENTKVTVGVTAADGYQISSVAIGGAAQTLESDTTFSKEITVTANTEISVVFAKVYTVTVTHNENGSIEIVEPATVGGTVTVEAGTTVKIEATPEANYRVSEVKINSDVDNTVTGANDSGYEKTLAADKDYTVVITFAPNTFAITKGQTENGSIVLGSESVDYNGSCAVTVTPAAGDSVTSVKVNGTEIGMYETENGAVKFTIANITEAKNVEATFAATEKAIVDVESLFNDEDAVRTNGMTYIYAKDSSVTFTTDKDGILLYSKTGAVIGGGKDVKTVTISETTEIAKIELVYKADSEMAVVAHEVDGVSSGSVLKIVVDNKATESTLTPDAANENGYYNSDVTFAVKAEDKGDFSGLALVEYWITLNGVDGKTVTLYEYKDGEEVKAVHEDSIAVDASVYNSKDVKVTLRVLDRAGNEEVVEKAIKINSTKPIVSLAINGTQNNNAREGYYNDQRTLTITVIDREDTFSQVNAAKGLEIYKDGTLIDVSATDLTWKHTEGSNQYEGTYVFAADAHYKWSFTYENLAGVSSDGVTVDTDSKDIYEFYVDKAEPYSLTITYNPTFVDVLLETVTFGFYQAPVEVTIEAIDDTAGIHQFDYSYGNESGVITETNIQRDGNKASAKFTIPAEFRGSVSFAATDRAGRTAELADDKVVVIDTIAPGVTVTWDPAQGYNGKYFNTDRTATIEIKEANFFAQDIEDGLLKITANIVYNDGSRKNETYKPAFTFDNGKYVAAITFSEDADYTFDIVYTDRSGNVYDEYPAEEFKIDKTAPVISVEYNNNTAINENQFKAERTATITVVEHNFNKTAMNVLVNGNATQVEWIEDETVADTYTAEVPFPGNAHYTFGVNGKDFAENANDGVTTAEGTVAPWDFTVNKDGPANLKITYEPTFVGTLFEGLTFGFYKAPVTVKIEATDDISGIDYFTYSYTVQDDVSDINVGKQNVQVDANGENFITFEIPAQFRGFVSFSATNKSGVSASTADTKAVVVDDIAPGIQVVYGNYDALNDKYYKDDRTATITIEEANFFAKDIEDGLLVITRKAVANDGTIKEEILAPQFTKIEGSDKYVATIDFDQNADYTFDIKYTDRSGNVYDEYDADQFTVDKIAPVISIEEANGAYFNSDRTVKITVVEHNFRASDFVFTAEAYNVLGNTEANKIDLSSKAYQTYLQNQDNWTKVAADTWETVITFDIEGNYEIGATYTDLAGNPQVEAISDTFCVDKPDAGKDDPNNLKISYEPTFVGTLLETITFGFYKAPLKVTIEATDDIAGVDYFVYSYTVQTGASATNEGKSNVTVDATRDGSTNRWYATFDIPAQFRGNVSFTAYDLATNHASLADKNVVIVDNVAPGINVTYENMNDYDAGYFDAQRKAIIKITEANFFEQDIADGLLVITVEKTTDDGMYTSTAMSSEFTKAGDVYTAEIPFVDAGDYTFDIKYTDRSGNVYDSYEKDVFTVDKTAPVINVSYDNNSAKNGDQFKADRIATIQITEHNFDPSKVVATVTANGNEVPSYAEYLAKTESWTKVEGKADTWQAEIKYTEEAHYTFAIVCTDKAGNTSTGVEYGESVAPAKFTLDKSVPTEMDIKINDVSVAGSMETIAFNKFYGKQIVIKLSANCDISGLESLKYQKVADVTDYDEDGAWTNYNAESGIVINPSEKLVIYFRAEDRAGNVKIIRSTGIVVDDQMPIGETNAPEIDILPAAPNANGMHKGDVSVALKVVDPKYAGATAADNGHYSGLNKITYKIYTTDTDAVEEGTLLDLASKTDGAVFDADKLVSSWSGKITIDSEKFNSNNVIVEVIAVDNAGNERKTTTIAGEIKIDITAPTIKVSYDNNDGDTTFADGVYFKANRTATIEITERNFDPADVKIIVTNTDGVIPTLSAWTTVAGGGNGDNTTHTATITYDADGDYTFDISYIDEANNANTPVDYGTALAPTKFTVDKTLPVVSVNYNDNNVEPENGNYYKEQRVATITVTEHNFDSSRVVIALTGSLDGVAFTADQLPKQEGWNAVGDVHTLKITYAADGLYNFDFDYTDKAGNNSADIEAHVFHVDKIAPVVTIQNVKNESANNDEGNIGFVIEVMDINLDTFNPVLTVTDINGNSTALAIGTPTDIEDGKRLTVENIEADGIYRITCTSVDKAGNAYNTVILAATEETKATTEGQRSGKDALLTFSVNRDGSTYIIDESTLDLIGKYYVQNVTENVVISEINADPLQSYTVTLNGTELAMGKDYTVTDDGGNGTWMKYTYSINKDLFADEGEYVVVVSSTDKANNNAFNDVKNASVTFVVDRTAPVVAVSGLATDGRYQTEQQTVTLIPTDDGGALKSLVVRLVTLDDDGNVDEIVKELVNLSGEELQAALESGNGEIQFTIDGANYYQNVQIICNDCALDEAGETNVSEQLFVDVTVSSSAFMIFWANRPLRWGTIAGVILLVVAIIFFLIFMKKRKKDEKK